MPILFFYRRVFPHPRRSLTWAIYFAIFVTISRPFKAAKGQFIDLTRFYVALAMVNMLNDVFVLLIPFPRIVQLQMKELQKLAICGAMALESFQRRTYQLHSTIELAIGIVCACLPHLAPLAQKASARTSPSIRNKESSAGYGWRSIGNTGPERQPEFDFGANRLHGQKADDQIGLTNYVAAGGGARKPHSLESTPEDDSIVVQSSFTHTGYAELNSLVRRQCFCLLDLIKQNLTGARTLYNGGLGAEEKVN
ncbi:hypothetical protein AJ79_00750 [Helicocarpus griseus UAMH5409]|uniref:Rhodopsin domain-containing protein n=1 Tax=Helicocarpus griseus UAMH5409 TaxID=1447875 RepID=A0A2B7YB74_9EURO|nr:hypothetical protein AJ79_00750 [Helicocarpus griseus UAMH5409]